MCRIIKLIFLLTITIVCLFVTSCTFDYGYVKDMPVALFDRYTSSNYHKCYNKKIYIGDREVIDFVFDVKGTDLKDKNNVSFSIIFDDYVEKIDLEYYKNYNMSYEGKRGYNCIEYNGNSILNNKYRVALTSITNTNISIQAAQAKNVQSFSLKLYGFYGIGDSSKIPTQICDNIFLTNREYYGIEYNLNKYSDNLETTIFKNVDINHVFLDTIEKINISVIETNDTEDYFLTQFNSFIDNSMSYVKFNLSCSCNGSKNDFVLEKNGKYGADIYSNIYTYDYELEEMDEKRTGYLVIIIGIDEVIDYETMNKMNNLYSYDIEKHLQNQMAYINVLFYDDYSNYLGNELFIIDYKYGMVL